MSGGEEKKKIVIYCEPREKESIEELLQKIEQLPDQKLETMFRLMPHQVMDVKDALRKSSF